MGTEPRKPRRPRSRTEDPPYYEALGRAIKVARAELGLERKELAERSGVSYAYLSDIESGRGRPSSQALRAIAEALGVSPSSLMRSAEVRTSPRSPSPSAPSPADASDWTMYERTTPAMSMPPPGRPSSALRDEVHQLIDQLPDEALASLLSLIRSLSRR